MNLKDLPSVSNMDLAAAGILSFCVSFVAMYNIPVTVLHFFMVIGIYMVSFVCITFIQSCYMYRKGVRNKK